MIYSKKIKKLKKNISNKKLYLIFIILIVINFFYSHEKLYGKVSFEKAKQLGIKGTPLTPIGAQRSGNEQGTIPDWIGGITIIPSEYKKGNFHPLPFKADKKILTIAIDNYEQYKDKLTDGLIKLFQTYPKTFKINIYPTHRTASYPEWVYQASIKNAINAEIVENGNGIKGARVSSPFPIPANGLQAIWNHILCFRGTYMTRFNSQSSPMKNGTFNIIKIVEKLYTPYSNINITLEEFEEKNVIMYFMQYIKSPPRMAGNVLLVYEYLNQVKQPRRSWIYHSGQRRVRSTPNIAYDYPGTASDGLRTTDDWNCFNGSPDRYEWKLIGKKEMYIPYNCYKLHSDKNKFSDILKPGHINQNLVRYELHRVWIVEANLKTKYRHIYKKRVFYLDEDSWNCVASEMYDRRNKLYRILLSHTINYYEVPLIWTTLDVYHDIYAHRYLASQLDNEDKVIDFSSKMKLKDFTINALRRAGIR